jgi:hypothetical protein
MYLELEELKAGLVSLQFKCNSAAVLAAELETVILSNSGMRHEHLMKASTLSTRLKHLLC